MQQQTEVLQSALALARNYYATASIQKRQHLSSEILNSEQQLEQLQREIHELEKLIRNTENR
jgi:glutaredoxin 2